jgi:hypothetical protein
VGRILGRGGIEGRQRRSGGLRRFNPQYHVGPPRGHLVDGIPARANQLILIGQGAGSAQRLGAVATAQRELCQRSLGGTKARLLRRGRRLKHRLRLGQPAAHYQDLAELHRKRIAGIAGQALRVVQPPRLHQRGHPLGGRASVLLCRPGARQRQPEEQHHPGAPHGRRPSSMARIAWVFSAISTRSRSSSFS